MMLKENLLEGDFAGKFLNIGLASRRNIQDMLLPIHKTEVVNRIE